MGIVILRIDIMGVDNLGVDISAPARKNIQENQSEQMSVYLVNGERNVN